MQTPEATTHTAIWWGRSDTGYSRNAVVRSVLSELGWSTSDFRPSSLAGFGLGLPAKPAQAKLVWVPCFRQRDMTSAARFAKRHGLPLVFDPLISAYDKQVFERHKFAEGSARARRLLAWERARFALADLVLADTQAHANYFEQVLGVPAQKLAVLPVGADESLFKPMPFAATEGRRIQVLFYGSYIHLQGPEVIVRAAALCPEVDWVLLGDGPLRQSCEALAKGHEQITFEPWIDYARLPARIASADILLGVFSDSDKAGRVVPNKLYQAIACARPVVTRTPLPGAMPWHQIDPTGQATGVVTVAPNDPKELAQAVRQLAAQPQRLPQMGQAARATFDAHGSATCIKNSLKSALNKLGFVEPLQTEEA